jgi:hypothetical protein
MERPVSRVSPGPEPSVPGRLAVAALAVIAVLPFRVLLADSGYLVLAAVAVAVVTAISWALSPRRPLALSVMAGTGALAAGAALLLVTGGVEPPMLATELMKIPAAWNTLLESVLPAAVTPQVLVLPVGGAAVAGFMAAELGARTRWLLLAAVPPAVLFVVSVFVVGRQGPPAPAAVGAFVAGVLAVAAIERARSSGPRRTGAVIALAMGVMGAAIAAAAPIGDRADLRDGRGAGSAAVTHGDPLGDAAAARGESDDPVVFRLTGRPSPSDPPDAEPLRLRLATLDSYDGEFWRVGRTFGPAGHLLARAYDVPEGPLATYAIALTAAHPGPFVPSPAAPTELGGPGGSDGERLRYDREVGDLVMTGPSGEGLAYEVTAPATRPTTPVLNDEARLRLTALPPQEPPVALRSLVGLVPAGSPRERADALAAIVREGPWGFDDDEIPGHSYQRLDAFVRGSGTMEQPPALHAVLARMAGMPARIVVGYDLARPAPGETVEVRARQVWVWTEVHVPGDGWVIYDVTPHAPRPVATPDMVTPRSTTPTTNLPAGRSPAAATTLAPAPEPGASSCPPPGPCETVGVPGSVGWPVTLALGLAVVPLAIVVGKRLRRWARRHRRSPAARLSGAWRQSVSDLRSHRITLAPGVTAAELARKDDPPLDTEVSASLTRLARVLDTAVFAAPEPDDDLADEAWASHAGLAGALRSGTTPPRRLLIALDPRPLVERH